MNIGQRFSILAVSFKTFFYAGMAFLCVATVLPAGAASADRTLAILPFNNSQDSIVSAGERRQLVQSLRGIARRSLSKAQGWNILTGENLEARAPSGMSLPSCEDAACAVAAGRTLQVDYIVAGNIGRVGPYLEASFSLYNVANGQLLGSEWPRGKSVEDIIDSLEGSPDPLFVALSGGGGSNPEVFQTVTQQSYPPGTHVVTYYRRPVYVNPFAWLWIPLFILFFSIPFYSYHGR